MRTYEQESLRKAVFRQRYSSAFWTALAPGLIFFSLLCGAIGRSNLDFVGYYNSHPIITTLWIFFIVGLLIVGGIQVIAAAIRSRQE